ncbi:hypothetical protein [Pulveribacter suum]|uniref:hypothetical protein n=1 Tax=Pulveribacter suum TaxID=2116657 RepID=UPI00130091CB|nr:hypothetical protein [Pulveribacter suum]
MFVEVFNDFGQVGASAAPNAGGLSVPKLSEDPVQRHYLNTMTSDERKFFGLSHNSMN